jgi:hypothetical protein
MLLLKARQEGGQAGIVGLPVSDGWLGAVRWEGEKKIQIQLTWGTVQDLMRELVIPLR